jgi:hypothetical protein
MDVLSQLYHAVILDEDGDLVGRVDSIHLLGGRMVIMLATNSVSEDEIDPDGEEIVPTDNIKDRIAQLKEVAS